MASQTTIRVLRVQSEERGAAEVAAKLKAVAGAATQADAAIAKYADEARAGAVPINEALAKSQDGFSKATLSTARSIQNLERRIDPVARTLNDFERAQKKVNLAIDSGQISADKGAKILAGYEQRYVRAAQSSKLMQGGLHAVNDNAGLASHQLMNLTRQGNDVITMFALGASPMQIFASQAGQVYDSVSSGPGGLTGGLNALKNSAKAGAAQIGTFALSLGPWGLAIAAATAAVGAFVYAFRDDLPDMNDTLEKQEDILKQIESRYDGIRDKIETLPKASTAGLNVQAGINLRDLDKLLQSETGQVNTLFSDPTKNLLGFGEDPTSDFFAPIKAAVEGFRKSLQEGDPDVEEFRQKLSELYQTAGDDEAMRKAIERAWQYTATLSDLRDRADQVRVALKNFTDAQAAEQHATDTRLSASERQRRENDLAIRSISARTVAEKAAIAAKREQLRNSGKAMLETDDAAAQAAASQKVFAEATSEANGALREARAAMETAGLTGFAQQMAEINAQIERQIELNPENAETWRKVGEARKNLVETQTRKDLFQSQRDTLIQLAAEAGALRSTDAEYKRLMATVQAKIDLERRGIDATNAAGQAYVENAGKIADYNAAIEKQRDAWDDVRSTGEGAIDDIFGGLTDGAASFSDEITSILEDVEQTFIRLAITNPLKNALFGTNYGTLSDLFNRSAKAPSLSMPGLGGLGATPATAMWVRSAGGLGSLFGSPANDNFLKGYRPGDVTRAPLGAINDNLSAAARAIKSIESGGNYSALGPLTKSGDRAYGAYQVMGANVGPWTQKAVGYAMTPKQFMAAPWAQDAVFNRQFGGYAAKYGSMQDAASAWFTGRPLSGGANAVDVLGTTGSQYVDRFNDALKNVTQTTGQVTNGFSSLSRNVMPSLASSTGNATQGLGNLGSGLSKFGTSLSNWYPPAPGGGGGWAPGGIFSALGNFFRFGGSSQAFMATFTPGMYAEGGLVSGPGTGTSDSIPARLSNGEFVVNAAATRMHFSELVSMNSNRFASGGPVGSARPSYRHAPGSLKIVVNNNGAPVDATAEESTDSEGNRQVEIMLEKKIDDRVLRPSSPTNRQLRSSYGLSQQVVRR